MRAAVAVGALALAGCSLALDPSGFLARDGGMDAQAGDGRVRPCTCSNASDVCTRDERGDPVCTRPGVACSSCPAGYSCLGGTDCRCTDSRACGAECARDEDCGTARCDRIAGVCRPPLGCLNQWACEDLCIDLRCVEGGFLPPGAACRSAADCDSGACVDGFCEEVCFFNDDCGTGRTCVFRSGSFTSVCVPTPPACATCIDEFSVCLANGECVPACEAQFDCDEDQRCVLGPNGYGCRATTMECGKEQVAIESAGACALPLGCYTADDPACPAGFECLSEESLGLGNRIETGFCVAVSGR